MANDLNGSPYKIDTAGVIIINSIFVNRMVWKRPAAAGDNLVVLDSNGRTLWDENAYIGGTGVSIEQDINQNCEGITIDTIASGTLFIYYR